MKRDFWKASLRQGLALLMIHWESIMFESKHCFFCIYMIEWCKQAESIQFWKVLTFHLPFSPFSSVNSAQGNARKSSQHDPESPAQSKSQGSSPSISTQDIGVCVDVCKRYCTWWKSLILYFKGPLLPVFWEGVVGHPVSICSLLSISLSYLYNFICIALSKTTLWRALQQNHTLQQ